MAKKLLTRVQVIARITGAVKEGDRAGAENLSGLDQVLHEMYRRAWLGADPINNAFHEQANHSVFTAWTFRAASSISRGQLSTAQKVELKLILDSAAKLKGKSFKFQGTSYYF